MLFYTPGGNFSGWLSPKSHMIWENINMKQNITEVERKILLLMYPRGNLFDYELEKVIKN